MKEDVYFLLKMVIFQCHVTFQGLFFQGELAEFPPLNKKNATIFPTSFNAGFDLTPTQDAIVGNEGLGWDPGS